MASDTGVPQAWQWKSVLRALNSFAPPSGAFDPEGRWEHAYNIYFLNVRGDGSKGKGKGKGKGAAAGSANAAMSGMPRPDGTLKIVSAPKGDGVELLVEASALMNDDMTTARVQCKKDALCSPVSWDLRFTNALESGQKLVTFSKTGAVKGGVLIRDGKPVKEIKRLDACTCDWSLFDAVQRLGRANAAASTASTTSTPSTAPAATLSFNMLEYLDVVRENQTLRFRGKTAVTCSGKDIEAREYLQFGDGVLPTQYFLDSNHRLFMVLGSRRLFVLVNEKV